MAHGDDVKITLHRPHKCGFQATAMDSRENVAVAHGDFGAGYPTEELARAAVRRIINLMRKTEST